VRPAPAHLASHRPPPRLYLSYQVEAKVDAAEKAVKRSNDKKTKDELVILRKVYDHLNEGKVGGAAIALCRP
jgi:hypothetical protein